MKLLVFGKTGQLASELQRLAKVTALGRAQVNLEQPEACAAAILSFRPDAIINAAAYTAVDQAETDETRATIINADAPSAMAQAASKLGVPLVHISTDYVFDGSGTLPHLPDAAPGPINAYGRSKLAGENRIRALQTPHAILRTSWVFSAHGNNFVKTMLRLAQSRDALSVVQDQIGGPTSAADIAAACLEIAKQLCDAPDKSGTYHFTGAPAVSWANFAREIFAQAGQDITVTGIASRDYPTPAPRPLNSRLDCSSLFQTFNIPQPDWRHGLRQMLYDMKVL